jgi:GH25 family lysozyme M1 (1,4-beta-N-acetylmuramidase)
MGIYGQDWASYQGAQPNTSGLSFAFTKVSEGLGYTNPRWVAQRDHAKASGLVWGGYHYPHMANSPQAEADYFLSQVAWQPGDLIVLDWEGYDQANQGVSRAAQLAYKEAWLRYVKGRMPHNPVGMYCNADYWTRVDTSGYFADFLWIATAGRVAGDPGIQAPWLFHQYSDQPVDSDYCHLGSVDELRSWALSFASPAPAPAPTTPAPTAPAATPSPAPARRVRPRAYRAIGA